MDVNKEAMAIKIGSRLAEIRKEKGIKQIEICNRTGILVNHLSKIETGKTIPSVIEIILLCSEYKIEMSDVFRCNECEMSREKLKKEVTERMDHLSDSELNAILTILKTKDNQIKKDKNCYEKNRWIDEIEM